MIYVVLVILMAVYSMSMLGLHSWFKEETEGLKDQIQSLETKLRKVERRADKANNRVDAVENFVVNKAIQSRYPAMRGMEIHVEDQGYGRLTGHINEVV